MTSEYRDIPGFPGYSVTRDGRVRGPRGRDLKPRTAHRGHLNVGAYLVPGKQVCLMVHIAVLLAWVGPRPDGLVGCHSDDDPSNNHVDNLRWDTRSANARDSVRNGGHPSHALRGKYKTLNDELVKSVKSRLAKGERHRDIAAEVGISKTTVGRILHGKIGAHVQ